MPISPTLLRTLRESVLIPGIAACLPWRLAYPMLRGLAGREYLFRPLADDACSGARMLAPIDDPQEWKRRYRLIRLVDHCDMYLVRSRTHRWFRRHVDVRGAWPTKGPFLAMTFHWGAGLWALADLHRAGLPVSFLSARFARGDFHGDWVAHRYARCRNSTVETAGGAPVIYTGGATQAIEDALARGLVVAALYDLPATPNRATVSTVVSGRPVDLPAGLARLAVAAGVPVVPFAMGLDYRTGRRRLAIEPAFRPADAQEFADRLAHHLSALIDRDTAAWHFSGYAAQFFTANANSPGNASGSQSAV